MKHILAYGGHLLAATFVVPWLTILAAGLTFGVFKPFLATTTTVQQFFSDHMLFLAFVAGASLAYSVSGIFTSKSALWVWIPAAAVFVLRVLYARESGSVLFRSGSFVEHFFTTSCQIQNWREVGFEARCFDRLYVTQLFAGSLAYSAGSAIYGFIHYRSPTRRTPATAALAVPGQLQIVTTPLAAFLALALAGSFLGSRFHAEMAAGPSSWQWLGSGVLSSWVVVIINSVTWGAMSLMAIGLARAPLRKDEKALFISFIGSTMLIPIGALLPRVTGLVHIAQTMLSLMAFLAGLAILVSLWNDGSGSQETENGWRVGS